MPPSMHAKVKMLSNSSGAKVSIAVERSRGRYQCKWNIAALTGCMYDGHTSLRLQRCEDGFITVGQRCDVERGLIFPWLACRVYWMQPSRRRSGLRTGRTDYRIYDCYQTPVTSLTLNRRVANQ